MSRRRELDAMFRLVYDARRFFKNFRFVHGVLAFILLATGVAALILSNGSNGSAKVPYFFSAFFAGAWHIKFVVNCQVCLYYLKEDGSRSCKAGRAVTVYSFSCSLFVLFNVMGVVFAVVNGICIKGQMCYYDRNEVANRSMAILLIIEHCVCILLSVLLAKKAYVIDAGLKSDVAIRLNHPFTLFYRREVNTPQRTSAGVAPAPMSSSVESVCARRESMDTPDLHHVQTDHEGKVMSTVEISAKRRKKFRKNRSKSNPNLKREALKPQDIDGEVYSIFSDSEAKDSRERRRSKTKVFRVKNRVSVVNKRPKRDDVSDEDDKQEVEIVQTTTVSVKSSGKFMRVKPFTPEIDEQTTTSDDTICETESPPSYDSVIKDDTPVVDT